MTDRLVDVSLTEWEDGIDLILDTRVALPPTRVWPYVKIGRASCRERV